EGALVFPVWQWFQAVYLQEIEGRRPDLQIMATTELKRPEWFRATADRRRFPNLRLPEGVPLHADNFARYMPALINANIGERRVFIETDQDTDEPLQGHLAPAGFLFEVLPDDEASAHPTDLVSYFRDLRGFLEAEIERPEFFEDRGAAQTYSCLASSVGLHLLRSGRPPAAIALFELSRLMDPMSTDSVALIGAARHAMNDLEGAERALREAVALAPYRAFPRVTLGNVLLDRGRWAEADALFAAVLEEEPENAKALLGRGYAAMEQGKLAPADGFVRAALERAEGGALAERARSALDELDRMRVRAGRGASQGSTHVPG
ncbi:MAG: tetratricopeptide repeat protein, partial [Candidatus Methylomirabilis sp.]|nr:tetratricopeptide repeat protein [Deltaproteobacteria bacterium]